MTAPMYKLIRRELMSQLMQRSGSGHRITIRTLAETAGIPHGTVGNLLTGEQASVPVNAAHAIAEAIGVDVLILFTPIGRSVSAPEDDITPALTHASADTTWGAA